MSIYDRLMYLALGGKESYRHKNGMENKQTTKLQDFLDDVASRKS